MVAFSGDQFGFVRRRSEEKALPEKSNSCKRDAEMWAKSVEKVKDTTASFAVEPLLVSEETASAMLGISPRTAWQLAEGGVLKVKRVGRRKLYLVDSLKAFAESETEVE